jgi:hypothetical protein
MTRVGFFLLKEKIPGARNLEDFGVAENPKDFRAQKRNIARKKPREFKSAKEGQEDPEAGEPQVPRCGSRRGHQLRLFNLKLP